jgi:hypothetical protein
VWRKAISLLPVALCGCTPAMHPFVFPETASIPPAVTSDSLRTLVEADRDRFLGVLDTQRVRFYAERAGTNRTRQFRYTLANLVAAAVAAVGPEFVTSDRTKKRVAQGASGVGLVLTGVIAFHRDGERAKENEICARRLNTARVEFSSSASRLFVIADSLQAGNTRPWDAYNLNKQRIASDLQNVCSVTGRTLAAATP